MVGKVLGLALLVALVGVHAAGCAGGPGQAPVAQAEVSQATVFRATEPQLPEGDLATLAAGNSASGMGMPSAMAPGPADFSGMDGSRDLFISGVFHKAIVVVDEQGTEAAAATGAVVGITSAPADRPVVLSVDRPFIFLFRDLKTGTLLFMGRVLNPAG